MRLFLLSQLLLVTLVVVANGFLLLPPTTTTGRPGTARAGIFDKFVESMEAGYKGDDSAFQKQKAADAKKQEEKRKQAEARKARGYTKLSEVKERSFSKLKYEDKDDEPPAQEKKFFGLF